MDRAMVLAPWRPGWRVWACEGHTDALQGSGNLADRKRSYAESRLRQALPDGIDLYDQSRL